MESIFLYRISCGDSDSLWTARSVFSYASEPDSSLELLLMETAPAQEIAAQLTVIRTYDHTGLNPIFAELDPGVHRTGKIISQYYVHAVSSHCFTVER